MKVFLVTIAAVSCNNHPIRGLCCDLSWLLNIRMQETQRFSSRVVKSCRVVCWPRMKESIVLGLEGSRHCPSSSFSCDARRLVCMSTHILWSTGLVGAPQKMKTIRTLLRGSSSKIRLHQLQFTISRMVSGVKVGRITVFRGIGCHCHRFRRV